jgi:hypothetical protein
MAFILGMGWQDITLRRWFGMGFACFDDTQDLGYRDDSMGWGLAWRMGIGFYRAYIRTGMAYS